MATTDYGDDGDYIVKDQDGNIISAQITGDSVVQDNDDGTSTETTITNTTNVITGKNTTTTITKIIDTLTNEVISRSVNTTGNSGVSTNFGNLLDAGLGNSDALTGDQYAKGVDALLSGDDSSIGNMSADFGETPVFDAVYVESDIPEKLSIPDLFTSFISDSPLFDLLDTFQITTNSTVCKLTSPEIFGISIDFDFCSYESMLRACGAILFVVIQALSILIIFRGWK